jgi:hypothetical protein
VLSIEPLSLSGFLSQSNRNQVFGVLAGQRNRQLQPERHRA